MAKGDRLSELVEIKKRSGKRGSRFPDANDLAQLEDWAEWSGPKELVASLLPARIVTLVEVFCRYWIQKLIDHGPPYVERAAGLKVDVKYDLQLVHSLQGQTISLGLLISNSVSLASTTSIAAIFSTLIGQDFFDWLKNVQSRIALEYDRDAAPVISDVGAIARMLARLFEVRHILVHEFPETQPVSADEIDEMIAAASTFIEAADEGLTQLVYGRYPVAQQEMNRIAQEESEAVDLELEKLAKSVAAVDGGDIFQVQKSWRVFAESEAERQAKGWTGGSAWALIYYTALKQLSDDRLEQLQSWFDEETRG
jgi:lysozyme inhibitor LprI